MRHTCWVVLAARVLPAEAPLTLQREAGLDLGPQLLVDQRVVAAVLSGPGGDPLPAHWTAQRGFIHRLQEAALKHTARTFYIPGHLKNAPRRESCDSVLFSSHCRAGRHTAVHHYLCRSHIFYIYGI